MSTQLIVLIIIGILVLLLTRNNSRIKNDNEINKENVINYFINKNAVSEENAISKKDIAKVIKKSTAFKKLKKEQQIVFINKSYYIKK